MAAPYDYEPLLEDAEAAEGAVRYDAERSRRRRWRLATAVLFFAAGLLFTFDTIYDIAHRASGFSGLLYETLWPDPCLNKTDSWQNENSKALHSLVECVREGSCGKNQTSIVLLSSFHFEFSIEGHVSGEDIWAKSVLLALREMGYTAIFAPNNDELARTYRQFPDLVKVAILEGSAAQECWDNPWCIKKPEHPLGIPAWKMLSFHFWRGAMNPLGNKWTLSPENFGQIDPTGESNDNVYLGYSIERTCRDIPVTPMDERPDQAYVLAKKQKYFTDSTYAWPGMDFMPPFPLNIVAGIREGLSNAPPLPVGIDDLGSLSQEEFYHQLGKSKLLIGIGAPDLSPSPYDALCMGVPFLNPILEWDEGNRNNRSAWRAQHNALKFHDPPYVYNVHARDEKAFWEAVRHALDTPIERYIVPDMTMESLKRRLGDIVERDWRGLAESLLDERNGTQETDKLFIL